MQHTLSFIIAVRNEPQYLFEATISGVLQTSTRYCREIIITDDGSLIPTTVEHPEITVIRNSEPIGSARSRRTGASFASGDVLVFLDPHMSFAPDWLDKMMAHVDDGSLLCAAWWNWELTKPVWWGAELVWYGKRDLQTGRLPGLAFRHLTRFPGGGAVEIPSMIGACYMMLRESYERAGGFSPFFRTWGKLEQDICSRARIVGLDVKCVTGARVGHFSRKKFPYPVKWDDINLISSQRFAPHFKSLLHSKSKKCCGPFPTKWKHGWRKRTSASFAKRWKQIARSATRSSFAVMSETLRNA